MQTRKQSGFTLIELIVVLAIIGLLAGMLLTALSAARTSAKKARAKSEVKQIELAWKNYLQEYHRFPNVPDGEMGPEPINILRGDTNSLALSWNPLRVIFLDFRQGREGVYFRDPWGAVYQVAVDGDGDGYTTLHGYRMDLPLPVAVWSYGPDGRSGTVDSPGDDIRSWE